MQLEQPEPKHGESGNQPRHPQSMAGASDEEQDGNDDEGGAERIGVERTDEVAAKHVLHAGRAAAQRARDACHRAERARETGVPREKRESRPCHQQRHGRATRVSEIDLHG